MANFSVEMACAIDSNQKVYRRSDPPPFRTIPFLILDFKNRRIITIHTYSITNLYSFTFLPNTMSASDIIFSGFALSS
jgi:hypothetical protein